MNQGDDSRTRDASLTPDERAWAARLASVWTDEGPSPALDACILAAARAAAPSTWRPARRRVQRRWPMLVGAAASLVIVVGLAWQLQPVLRSRPVLSEGPVAPAVLPGNAGELSAEVLAAADPVARRAIADPSSPQPASRPAPAANRPRPANPARISTAAPAPPAPAPPTTRRPDFGDDAIPPYADYAGTAAATQAEPATEALSRSLAATGEPARAAAIPAPQAFPATRDCNTAGAASAAKAATEPAAQSRGARRVRQLRDNTAQAPTELSTATATAPATAPVPPPAADADAQRDASDADVDRPGRSALDAVPVSDDVRLLPAAWLQRIRDRRDGGAPDRARDSLALFRAAHPDQRLPDDLARLGQ